MNELYHFGIKRRSGRYPWGSGDRPYQSEEKNIQTITDSTGKKEGKIKKVAKGLGKGILKLALTSAKLAALSSLGYGFIASEAGGKIMDAVIFKSGTFLLGSFARGGVSELYQIGQDFIDELLG